MGFSVIRLSASWREIAELGWASLDWLLEHAASAGQPVLLTVGMKALGWPEFHLPEGVLEPDAVDVRRRALSHVRAVVRRYRENPQLRVWQVENEPFNRSGPRARWISRDQVRREAGAIRQLDSRRPLAVTTFAHFGEGLDRASSRHQSEWKRRLGLVIPAEREALAVLRQGDILGVDVYRSIGWVDAGNTAQIARAVEDQLEWLAGWQRIARSQGKRFWVTESQAEPWEARRATHANPVTVAPLDIGELVQELRGIGVERILLWGSEYWLWRAENGDRRWLESVAALLGRRALA